MQAGYTQIIKNDSLLLNWEMFLFREPNCQDWSQKGFEILFITIQSGISRWDLRFLKKNL